MSRGCDEGSGGVRETAATRNHDPVTGLPHCEVEAQHETEAKTAKGLRGWEVEMVSRVD